MAVSAPRWGLATGAEPLRCGTLDAPPWTIVNRPMRGAGFDLITALASESGLTIDSTPLPFLRLPRDIGNGQLDLALLVRHPDVEAVGRVVGTVGRMPMGVLLRPGLKATSAFDLTGLLVGYVRGGAYLLTQGGLNDVERHELSDVSRGVEMLRAGRLDAYIGTQLAVEWYLRQQALDPRAFGGFLVLSIQPYQLYAGKNSRWHPDVEQRLTAACGQIQQQFDRLLSPYFSPGALVGK